MNALVLAAGFATRLYPLTLTTAKPLLEIAGKSILERIIEKILPLVPKGEIHVVSNGKFYNDFVQWSTRFDNRPSVKTRIKLISDGTLSNETRLGPLADVMLCLERVNMKEDLLIIAGDNLFDGNLTALLECRLQKGANVLGIFDMGDVDKIKNKFGCVEVDAEMHVRSFEEKPNKPKSSLTATALYLIRNEDLGVIADICKTNTSNQSNLGNLMRGLLDNGRPLHACVIPGWYDIGSSEDLEKAEQYYQCS